jgi:multiple sugar transport system permease protein
MQILQSKYGFTAFKRAIVYAILLFWSVICILPLYWMAITAFKDVSVIDKPPTYVPFLDFTPSLDAWRFILLDANENLVLRAVNSVIIGVCSTLATLLLGGMAVYGITRFTHKFSSFALMSIILSTRVLPPVAIALPLYVMAQFTGTLDSLGTLIFVYTAVNLPIAIWMLAPVFGPRATEQEEAAILDGATHIHIFLFVLIPMVRTAVVTVGLIVFLQCWNEYLFAVYLTSDHALTLPPWMVGQLSMKEAQTGGGLKRWPILQRRQC